MKKIRGFYFSWEDEKKERLTQSVL